jgi:carboxypeptidase PM20D1
MRRALPSVLALGLLAAAAPARANEPAPVVVHLAEAVRVPTISHQDREKIDTAAFETFLAFVRDTYPGVFSTLEVERVNQYSLLMRWPGTRGGLEPVLFDAHYDVVPIEPGTDGDWTHPPFSGVVADGFVWGRGSVDDKVAVIVTLDALESLVAEGFAPERTLYFSFVHDEEIGGVEGAGAVVEVLQGRGIRFAYVVGEGGGLMTNTPLLPGQPVAMIGLAEKSYLTLVLRATGTGGHSSMPPRDSSIVRLARALTELHENPFDARLVAPVDDMLRVLGEHRGGFSGWALRNQWLTRPLLVSQLAGDRVGSAMVRTTTAVTMIDAGVKENVVPQRAEARVNFRVLPDEAPEDVIAAVKDRIDDPQIEVTPGRPWTGNPGVADFGGEGYARIRVALEAAAPDFVVIPGMLMATTDSRHYAKLTPNVYRFHPMTVDVEDATGIHGTNERIPVEGVVRGLGIYRELIQRVGAR